MSQTSGGRPSKAEIAQRREKTRELYLKGKSTTQIATILGVHYNTALADVNHLQARYGSLVIKNSQLAERQMARVEQLLDEIIFVKDEYWKLFEEIKDKIAKNEEKYKEWENEKKDLKNKLEEAEAKRKEDPSKENRQEYRDLLKKLDYISKEPTYPTYVTTRIDTLKAIIDRLDKEAKLLNLFNPKDLIDKNYISIEVLKSIMQIFKGIIIDLIPEDKRNYAFKRLKTIDIQALNTEEVVEAEFKDNKPKKVKLKEIDEGEIDI